MYNTKPATRSTLRSMLLSALLAAHREAMVTRRNLKQADAAGCMARHNHYQARYRRMVRLRRYCAKRLFAVTEGNTSYIVQASIQH